MLTLMRRPGEKVYLTLPDGRMVLVEVTGVQGNKVRLGFEAPQDVKIMRDELAGDRK